MWHRGSVPLPHRGSAIPVQGHSILFPPLITSTILSPPPFPYSGIVFGNNGRLFIPMIAKRTASSTTAINVIFLVSTCSPANYLSEHALSALLPADSPIPSDSIDILLHGLPVPVSRSPQSSHFADTNVLGAAFFLNARLKLSIDYPQRKCQILQ